MRAWFPGTFLLLALVALASSARLTTIHDETFTDHQGNSPKMQLVRRMDGPSSPDPTHLLMRNPKYTHQQLVNGELPHATDFRPAHNREQFFAEGLFVGGKPLFLLPEGNNGVRYLDAQHALANYGAFHVHKAGIDQVITVRPSQTLDRTREEEPALKPSLVSEAIPEVKNGAKQVHKTQAVFGKNVALLTHGIQAEPLPSPSRGQRLFGSKKQKAPSWSEKVWPSNPVSTRRPLEDLRAHLNQHRFLRFEDSEGRLSLGLRAHPDGRVEHQFWDILRNRVHDFHIG